MNIFGIAVSDTLIFDHHITALVVKKCALLLYTEDHPRSTERRWET